MTQIDLLVAVRRDNASRYYKQLSTNHDLRTNLVTEAHEALEVLQDNERPVDVLVLDNGLPKAFDLIDEIRHTYPRLLIVLVDEEADFALPGQADEVSTDPFSNDDLARRITRLMSDRQLETLRADTMPAVREFAKHLRKAIGAGDYGKQEAAVAACRALGYDYVAFYKVDQVGNNWSIILRAHEGDSSSQAAAPKEAGLDDIMGWVAKMGQSRTAGPNDTLNHPLVVRGRMGMVAAVPVTITQRYGVLVACRVAPGSISQDHVMVLELISAQLAAAVSKEALG
jgi:hypothetical protein